MNFLVHAIPSLILVAGAISDLKSRRISNNLILICAAVALVFSFTLGGMALGSGFDWSEAGSAIVGSLISLSLAFAISLPAVMSKLLGAGDMKIFMAFGLAVNPNAVVNVFLYSLVWGGLLGLIYIIVSGRGKQFLSNLVAISKLRAKEKTDLHTIPYAVALLFGWLTHLTISQIPQVGQVW